MLADLQRDFQRWLVHATPSPSLGPAAGLAIYQNNYRAQLIGCLQQSYPKLRDWLGDDIFRSAAIRHIDAHPPHAWTLDAYADGFAATLSALYPDNPDLQELAWIEHALNTAFIAADATPVALTELAQVDWDTAQLQLTPSLHIHPATTNAAAIWDALWTDTTPPDSEMLAQPGGLLVWRRAYTTFLKPLDAVEHAALQQLQTDGSFTALCTMLANRLGETQGTAKAGELLANWLAQELITGIRAA